MRLGLRPSIFALAALATAAAQPGTRFDERELRWENDGATLVGSLFLPAGKGPFPAVVLIHAAGRSTRQQWPYRTHAELLARNGIAVLAYDKRGTGQSTGTFDRFADYAQLAGDALGGLNAIKGIPEIDPRRLGLWGRSQGAWLVALAASRSSDVRFAIPVAGGSVRPIEQELFVQANWLRKGGAGPSEIAQADRVSRLVWTYYATGVGREAAQLALDSLVGTPWFPAQAGAISGYPRSRVLEAPEWVAEHRKAELRWQSGLLWDPAPLWQRLSIPVLGLFGGSDQITPTDSSVARLEAALRAGGNRRFSIEVFPGAAHSLCPAEPPEALVDGCAAVPDYERRLVSWILALPR